MLHASPIDIGAFTLSLVNNFSQSLIIPYVASAPAADSFFSFERQRMFQVLLAGKGRLHEAPRRLPLVRV